MSEEKLDFLFRPPLGKSVAGFKQLDQFGAIRSALFMSEVVSCFHRCCISPGSKTTGMPFKRRTRHTRLLRGIIQ